MDGGGIHFLPGISWRHFAGRCSCLVLCSNLVKTISAWWFGTMEFYDFPKKMGISSSQLTNSIIFQRGGSTTNQFVICQTSEISLNLCWGETYLALLGTPLVLLGKSRVTFPCFFLCGLPSGELSHSNGKFTHFIVGKIHYFYGHFQ